ncbi:RcnB family protein [Sphingomonas kyungheensis]|uniref:RcnB family protein n=1 Tax=Sphingomonas kyungheensis TaxID=1069987 RepID=A0ABU8H1V9_9SPHN
MKTVIKALLAASMLMPVAAQAQDGRRNWDQRGPDGPGRPGPRPDDRGPRPDDGGPPRVADRGWQGRGDRPAPAPDRPPAPDRGPGGDRGPAADRPGPNRGPGPDRDGPRWANRGPGDDRGWDRRRDDGPQRRDWQDGRRLAERGGWDRGWRNDGRYDWGDHRASNRGAYRLPRYYAPSGWGRGYRRFGVGVSLSPVLFGRSYWISDPYAYRLPEAYGPYRWVRYYDDALLVDLRSGQVIDTVYDIFY